PTPVPAPRTAWVAHTRPGSRMVPRVRTAAPVPREPGIAAGPAQPLRRAPGDPARRPAAPRRTPAAVRARASRLRMPPRLRGVAPARPAPRVLRPGKDRA